MRVRCQGATTRMLQRHFTQIHLQHARYPVHIHSTRAAPLTLEKCEKPSMREYSLIITLSIKLFVMSDSSVPSGPPSLLALPTGGNIGFVPVLVPVLPMVGQTLSNAGKQSDTNAIPGLTNELHGGQAPLPPQPVVPIVSIPTTRRVRVQTSQHRFIVLIEAGANVSKLKTVVQRGVWRLHGTFSIEFDKLYCVSIVTEYKMLYQRQDSGEHGEIEVECVFICRFMTSRHPFNAFSSQFRLLHVFR